MAKIKNYDGRTGMELSYVRVQTVQAVQVARPRKKKPVDWIRITEIVVAGGIWAVALMMFGAALALQML